MLCAITCTMLNLFVKMREAMPRNMLKRQMYSLWIRLGKVFAKKQQTIFRILIRIRSFISRAIRILWSVMPSDSRRRDMIVKKSSRLICFVRLLA